MAEKDLVSMAQAFTGLPMNDLIGGPLMAAAEANNQMAITQAKYILDTGFYKRKETVKVIDPKTKKPVDKEIEVYEPVIVEMKLKRPVIMPGYDEQTGKPDPKKTVIDEVETVVSVPLITMLPINALAVDRVDISFEMEVKSSFAQERSQETQEKLAAESSFEAKIGYGPFSASISGSVAYSKESRTAETEKFEKSNSARYTVNVHASQQQQPAGLALMLEQFAKNIGPFIMGNESGGDPINAKLADSSDASVVEMITAGGSGKAFVGTTRINAD